jgi:hypothetical protein
MNKNKEETKIHSTYPFTMTHVCAIDNNMQLVNHQENVFLLFGISQHTSQSMK